jgi:hypothetical protein
MISLSGCRWAEAGMAFETDATLQALHPVLALSSMSPSTLDRAEPSLSDGGRLPALGHKSGVGAAIADDDP